MRLRAARPTHRLLAVSLVVMLLTTAALSGSGASAQNVETLRARAERLANELDSLERRASELDEQYLQLEVELTELEAERAEKQAGVDKAQAEVDKARTEAKGYLVEAYIGAGSSDRMSMGSVDMNAAVNQRALLEIVRGDREMLADDFEVSRQDLATKVSELEQAEAALQERRAEQAGIVEQIEASVAEHQQLLDGANEELRSAIEAERQRREAAAARAAEAAERQRAQQAAARAAEQRTTTTTGRREAASNRSSAPRSSAPAGPAAPAPAAPMPVSAPNGRAAGAIAAAQSVLGTPYRWAGSSPSSGFDCSGLLSWAWAKVGVSLPRTSRGMYSGTQRISASQLQPGDLVFYGSPVHHVGMYVGGGQMIHSPRTGDVVKYAPIHRGFGNPSGYGRIG